MLEIETYPLGYCKESEYTRVVCVSEYKGKFVFSYNKKRKGWEIPGGHIENYETWEEAARREMYEETGATKIEIDPVCVYKINSFALLCFCKIIEMEEIPKAYEMEKVMLCDKLPQNLTFPEVHTLCFDIVKKYINNRHIEEKCMELRIKQIIGIDDKILKITTDWMYNWWGIEENYSYEEVNCYMKNSFNDKKLPQTYGIFLDNKIIGMYQFTYRDLFLRPDIYPWLANLYIDEKYRNKGYGRKLIASVKNNAIKNLSCDEIYLYTEHKGLYEKYGWEIFLEENEFNSRTQKLYRLKIRE